MAKVLVDDLTGPAGPPGADGADGAQGLQGPPGTVDAATLRNIDAVCRYAGTQPARSTVTTDPLRRVRWVSDTEPTIGNPFAIDGDIWEDTTGTVTPPPQAGTIVRSTPLAPSAGFWSQGPRVASGLVIPAGAVLVVATGDSSDNTGADLNSTPILTNSGTARTWSRIAAAVSGPTAVSRLWADYWYNDTGIEVTLDLTMTWGPGTPGANFNIFSAYQLLEGVADPASVAPKHVQVNSGSNLAATITPTVGDQVLMAFCLAGSGATALGTDYLTDTDADVTAPTSYIDAHTDGITGGWVFRDLQEIDTDPVTVGMNTPNPTHPLAIAVAFAALSI